MEQPQPQPQPPQQLPSTFDYQIINVNITSSSPPDSFDDDDGTATTNTTPTTTIQRQASSESPPPPPPAATGKTKAKSKSATVAKTPPTQVPTTPIPVPVPVPVPAAPATTMSTTFDNNNNNNNKLATITRTNSAKNPPPANKHNGNMGGGFMMMMRSSMSSSNNTNNGGCGQYHQQYPQRKLSTIVFQEPPIIKRPNSTIGIPSMRDSPNSLNGCHQFYVENSNCNLGLFSSPNHHHQHHSHPHQQAPPMATLETPESDVSIGFNPITPREKAASLTLPDPKFQLLRKGSSNPFLTTTTTTTNNNNHQNHHHHQNVSPDHDHQQYHHYHMPKVQRTSIILNGNILHSISPIPPARPPGPVMAGGGGNSSSSAGGGGGGGNQLSVYVPDTVNANGNNSGNIGYVNDGRLLNSAMKTRTSTISSMTNHRSSYIGDEEHYHLQQQYFSTTGRKDTIISIGKNLQIQFKSPSTHCLSWRYRTGLEKFLILLLLAIIVFLFIYINLPNIFGKENKLCTSMECVKTAASLLDAMDLQADPCEDFFQFACGNWVKKHVIPEDRSSLSTFEVLADELQIILKDLLEQQPNSADNSATLKAKRFYQSCMNTQKIDEIGAEPILDALREVGGWPVLDRNWNEKTLRRTKLKHLKTVNAKSTTNDVESILINRNNNQGANLWMNLTLENLLGKLRGDFNQPIILEQYVGPDDRNSSLNIIQFDQTSLGLPSREYFLKENPNKEKEAYLELMVDMAELLGAERSYAQEQLEKVLDFETELANASMPEADRHDTSANYNRKTIKQLTELVPEFDWLGYLNNFMPTDDIGPDEEVVVYSLDYYQKIGKLLQRIMLEDRRIIINYAVWRLMKSIVPFLDNEFGVKRAKFRKVLYGISADRTRWSQCVELVNKKMGMAVGALFIRDNFDPKSKEMAIEMIHNIRQAFNELLDLNEWMDDETKLVAKEKANAINERIGYPDLLTNPIELSKEYNYLELNEDKFLPNIMSVWRFEAYKNLIKLGTPVDKDSWTTDPAVVNAFYSPNKNDIVFPAGILQPLFYAHYFPKSLNYGGIGVVIGHEITHGFDDRGRQFDKNGNMKQWWNNETISKFRERAQCIIDQYSSYVLEDINANVNGRMTQGENIADNGGLKQAYRAFKKWELLNGVEPLLPGMNFTHDQLFFLNYAQIWCGSMRPEEALNKIRSSVHSPGPIRVLGPLSNSYDFSYAYQCPVGSRMNPVKKCSVW